MLVDEDPNALYLLSMIMKLNDFDVIPFTNPELALASLGKDQYDLLLLDVRMPNMTAFDMYKRMKKIDNRAQICFITNYRQECFQRFRESFPELAPSSLVEKPVSSSALLEILKVHLIS